MKLMTRARVERKRKRNKTRVHPEEQRALVGAAMAEADPRRIIRALAALRRPPEDSLILSLRALPCGWLASRFEREGQTVTAYEASVKRPTLLHR